MAQGLFSPSPIMSADFVWAVALGRVKGVSTTTIVGKANAVQTSNPPLTIGFNNSLQGFASTAESWEIVSSSANDAAAGTGARTVVILTLDENYAPRTETITLNGTTAVALPSGAHYFRHQLTYVLTAGSLQGNSGNLTIRVTGAGASRGLVMSSEGLSRQASYTVPANCKLQLIDTNVFQAIATGVNATASISSILGTPNGVNLTGFDFTQISQNSNIHLDHGITLSEKFTLEYRVSAVSTNNVDVGVLLVGLLTDLSQIQFGSPA